MLFLMSVAIMKVIGLLFYCRPNNGGQGELCSIPTSWYQSQHSHQFGGEKSGILMACPYDEKAIEEVQVLPALLEKHASETQPIPLRKMNCVWPSGLVRIVCHVKCSNGVEAIFPFPHLVLFFKDDCWYRAQVLAVLPESKYQVIFLEYGNLDIIETKNLRPFKEEFLQVKALSSMCLLTGEFTIFVAHHI